MDAPQSAPADRRRPGSLPLCPPPRTPAGHQVVARALGRGARQHRRLNLRDTAGPTAGPGRVRRSSLAQTPSAPLCCLQQHARRPSHLDEAMVVLQHAPDELDHAVAQPQVGRHARPPAHKCCRGEAGSPLSSGVRGAPSAACSSGVRGAPSAACSPLVPSLCSPEVQHSVPQPCVLLDGLLEHLGLTDGEGKRPAHGVQHRHLRKGVARQAAHTPRC